MYQRNPHRYASRNAPPQRARSASSLSDKTAQISGASPNHANTLRHGGIGPASGNGSSSNPAESTAAAHLFHVVPAYRAECKSSQP